MRLRGLQTLKKKVTVWTTVENGGGGGDDDDYDDKLERNQKNVKKMRAEIMYLRLQDKRSRA